MTFETDALGGHLPLVDPADFTGAQRQLVDAVTATHHDAGFRITTPDGRPIGPFNPFLLRPQVALKLWEFSSTAQSQTSLSDRPGAGCRSQRRSPRRLCARWLR
jgi:4-carboxymuconolactone decarboxylase